MKKHVVLGIALSMGMMACQQEKTPEIVGEGDTSIRVEAAVSGNQMGRTVMEDDGSVSFTSGDKIGFFMPDDQAPRLFTNNNGAWETEESLEWPTLTESYTFHAFYPYVESAEVSEIPMPDLSQQSGDRADMKTYDFLSATKTCSYKDGNGVVSFVGANAFTHVYSLLLITLNSGTDNTLTSVKVEGEGCFTPHAYQFAAGKGEMIDLANASPVNAWTQTIEAGESTSATSREIALLLNPSATETQVTFTVGYTRQTLDFTAATSEISHTFAAGYCYKYQIRVSAEDQLIVEGHEVTSWIDGEVPGGELVVGGSLQ